MVCLPIFQDVGDSCGLFPALCCAGLLGAPSSRWFGVCVRAVCPGDVVSKGANGLDAAALCAWGTSWPLGVRTGRSGWAAKEDTSVRRSRWRWLLGPRKRPFWSSASLLRFGLCVLQGCPRVPLRISSGSPLGSQVWVGIWLIVVGTGFRLAPLLLLPGHHQLGPGSWGAHGFTAVGYSPIATLALSL